MLQKQVHEQLTFFYFFLCTHIHHVIGHLTAIQSFDLTWLLIVHIQQFSTLDTEHPWTCVRLRDSFCILLSRAGVTRLLGYYPTPLLMGFYIFDVCSAHVCRTTTWFVVLLTAWMVIDTTHKPTLSVPIFFL